MKFNSVTNIMNNLFIFWIFLEQNKPTGWEPTKDTQRTPTLLKFEGKELGPERGQNLTVNKGYYKGTSRNNLTSNQVG